MDAVSYDAVCLATSAVILGAGCLRCRDRAVPWVTVAVAGVASILMRGERCVLRRRCGAHTSSVLLGMDYLFACIALATALSGRLGPDVVYPAALALILLGASGVAMHTSPLQRAVHTVGHVVVASALVRAVTRRCDRARNVLSYRGLATAF